MDRKRHDQEERRRILDELRHHAQRRGGVVSRAQAYAAGLTGGELRAQVRAHRWQRVWSRSVCLHTGEVSVLGRQWAAVFEGGDRGMLDGESSLVASGLKNYETSVHRVSVPRGVKRQAGVPAAHDASTAGYDHARARRPGAAGRAGPPGRAPRQGRALGRATVLRLPLLGLRVAADEFFEQVERGPRDGGWCAAA